jgi:hypothetical protein
VLFAQPALNAGSPGAPISWKPSGAAMLAATSALSARAAVSARSAVSAAFALLAVFARARSEVSTRACLRRSARRS